MPDEQGRLLLGVLTQTLVKSPVIRSIIPARIRHADKNDVIFVRGDSIEIKEVTKVFGEESNAIIRDACLANIAGKADFDSTIRSARVLGTPRKIEQWGFTETPVSVIKHEEAVYRVQPSFYRPELPPQILVMALESSKLVFICMFYDFSGHVRWLSSYRVLPNYAQTYSKQLGEHIAVDPKSRAMAVAANEGSFVLYALKSMDQMKHEVEAVVGLQSTKFDPIIDERFFQVDGVILKMEFLHPSKTDTDDVILLVIAATKSKTKLHCYIWDSSADLRQASQLGSGQRVPDNEQLPLLLIPLTMSTAFMLVFQQHITVYTGILTGPATPHIHVLRHWEEPEEPGSSRSLPLFTQWARAMRRDGHVSIQDNIYLCREDGVVRFLEISENIRGMIESGHDAGQLKVNIDTAFASLDLGPLSDDLLAVGGNQSSGGLWFFAPRAGARLTFTIPNWTPTIDIAITETPEQPSNILRVPTNGAVRKRARIFASTGRGPSHGEITEMRYGIQGEVVGELPPVGNGVSQIWALHDVSGNGIHILISSPTDTTPLLINSDGGELPDTDRQLDVKSDASTIAAGLTIDGCIVQVTASTIVVTPSFGQQRHLAVSLDDESTTSAAILTSELYGCIVLTTTKREAGHFLRRARINTDNEVISLQQLGAPVELSARPSCTLLQEFQGSVYTMVGTSTGLLQVFSRNSSGSSLHMAFEHKFQGDFAICDSIAMVVDKGSAWLVCGLRNGTCQTFSVSTEVQVHLTVLEEFVLGSTSVTVLADQTQQNRAIVACEQHFCALEYFSEQSKPARIRNIILTNDERPGYRQGQIVAFSQAALWEHEGSPGFAAGQWFCIEGGNFHLVNIHCGSESAMVPRRMHLDGTPSRVAYSEALDKLIVLYTRNVVRRAPHHGRPGQRVIEPTFAFLDKDEELLRPDPKDPANDKLRSVLGNGKSRRANILTVQERKPGEKYLGMTEWMPTGGGNKYHMLIVFTMIVYVDNRAPTGRMLFFSLSKNPNGQVSMTCKKITELNAPVFAVVPYGESSLIYSCGNDLYLHTLKLTSTPREWLPPFILPLQSRGVQLSLSESLLYVTTAADSVSEFLISKDNKSLKLLHSDESARDGICHLHMPQHNLVVVSSKDGTITGLKRPLRPQISNTMSKAFIADFPGSITRLRYVTRPPWQLDQPTDPYRGDSDESIIGCTADGSFYQIDILDEECWLLLRFITNMAMRHRLICPYRETVTPMIDTQHPRHIEPASSNKRFMHIDGDILNRLLEHGAEELLRDMVEREPPRQDPFVDFETAAARGRRFWELALAAGVETPEYSAVVKWIRRKLASVL